MKGKRLSAMAMAAMLGVLLVPSSAYAANADWTAGNPLIAHALGEYDGKIETNSQEAFISSWENGYRVISNVGEDAGQTVKHLHFHVLGGEKLPV